MLQAISVLSCFDFSETSSDAHFTLPTVGNCKERWKNLRASLCRHLRQQQQQQASQGQGHGQRPKKPYYLAEHMEFVVPFTKTRP